jgi:hypothetical protein
VDFDGSNGARVAKFDAGSPARIWPRTILASIRTAGLDGYAVEGHAFD